MDEVRMKSILIVGGGTAGWMSAAYLQRALGEGVRITLVESSSVGRVGVGEATVPTMVETLRFLGIDERAFMRRCNATFKAAIKYVGWARGGQGDEGAEPDEFFHPFFDRPEALAQPFGRGHFPFIGEGFSTAQLWAQGAGAGLVEGLGEGLGESARRFDRACSTIPALCDAQRFGPARLPGSRTLQYAYHLDAGLFAEMLCELACARGVERRIEHIAAVELDARGFIDELRTESGERLRADFYVDCSGFRGLLINGALGEPFESDARYLACDRAVAIPASYDRSAGVPPYTQATALSAGWSWRVPLYHRYGCGYVYSSEHLEPEAAEAELRALIGPGAGEQANHIRMRIGRCRNAWVRNCVAVGLSSAFLEPLESTAIFSVEYQLAHLVNLFPSKRFAPARLRRYNQVVAEMYDHLRDFIVMHYCTTSRGDTPFWRRVRDELPIPDSLAETLEAYRVGVLPDDNLHFRLFRARSYMAILAGMGRLPEYGPPILDHFAAGTGAEIFRELAERTRAQLRELPAHADYVRGLHEGEEGDDDRLTA
ncbi:tryptophan 7-halogenase [Pseudenhygromyxa sp. WMMC2535]|uniref:tryptophan halogenase family protein n=1 Tax=Pseudenhygromyxa sp. WMMC2535 TaxID=2712867 RepID=UPI0015548857|nr:tryptophan halogenase family protein [Pseudenhygromyxa sp. WMMC2535]NVB37325.1 tryptophan 7-halogenase [Pseudenhygromyxa sp. WMMC2535]